MPHAASLTSGGFFVGSGACGGPYRVAMNCARGSSSDLITVGLGSAPLLGMGFPSRSSTFSCGPTGGTSGPRQAENSGWQCLKRPRAEQVYSAEAAIPLEARRRKPTSSLVYQRGDHHPQHRAQGQLRANFWHRHPAGHPDSTQQEGPKSSRHQTQRRPCPLGCLGASAAVRLRPAPAQAMSPMPPVLHMWSQPQTRSHHPGFRV